MAGVLQHLRSSTLNKRPNPSSMVDGQVAINYASGAPGMFFKDSNGALVKVGPVHVGSGAPNAVPASGGTAGNSLGEQWLDTSGGTYVFKIWDGSAWRSEAGEFVNVTGDTMTGALGIIAGSASSPSLFFSGDTNTGIYSPGADQVVISTNGTGRLFVDASGTVSITPSNALPLSIARSSDGELFRARRVGGTYNPGLTISASDTTNNEVVFNTAYSLGSAPQYVWQSGSNERMRLDSSGRLGLGTSSPSSALDVAGAISLGAVAIPSAGTARIFSRNTDSNLYIQTGSGNTLNLLDGSQNTMASFGASTVTFQTGNSARLTIDSSGRVGIGTNSAISKLHVSNSGAEGFEFTPGAASNTNLLTHYNRNGSFVYVNSQVSAASHQFFIGASEAARIDASSRLLVGTSTTRSVSGLNGRLQVEGTGAADSTLTITCNSATPHFGLTRTGSAVIGSTTLVANNDLCGRIYFNGTDGTGAVPLAFIDAAVDGTPGTNDMPGRIVLSTTADGASSPTERMRITSGGNILIGGTLPSSPNAEIKANGQFRCLNKPVPQSTTYLKYAAFGFNGQTLDVAAEIAAAVAGGATWSQAIVTLRGFDGGSVGYWHGIYSNGPAGGGVRATELANSGEVTLTVNGGNLTWPASNGTGQWYNTYITITLGSF